VSVCVVVVREFVRGWVCRSRSVVVGVL